jgi:hypothetical protein
MSEDRKRPTAGFWITVALVAVLVGYPLSFGPLMWLSCRNRLVGIDILLTAYEPLRLGAELWHPLGNAMDWYAAIGLRPQKSVTAGSGVWFLPVNKLGGGSTLPQFRHRGSG